MALLGCVGILLALVANALHPRGLSLTRDYFRGVHSHDAPAGHVAGGTLPQSGSDRTGGATGDPDAAGSLQSQGLQIVRLDQVRRFFEDPLYQEGVYVFVDARDAVHYRHGHIPWAYRMDHYRLGDDIASVIAACEGAEKVVVYCNGGDCEDSALAAMDLLDHGLDPQMVFVFSGGMQAWRSQGLPVETGARGSGDAKGRMRE